jgi:peptidoglycan LD-endopeptidase LytH
LRYTYLVLGTALALAALFLYYLAWSRRANTAQASAPTVTKDTHPQTYEASRRHQPESGGPPTSSWPHTGTSVSKDDYNELMQERLTSPIQGLRPADIQDTYDQGRANGKPHEATDILAPRGTPVLAIVDGTIQKLFTSVPGGLTIYEFDPREVYCYYYAHLDHYAEGLREGMQVKRGTVIGYVGTTGNAPANTPHLHLAIFKLGPEKRWWQGEPINPYPILKRLVE